MLHLTLLGRATRATSIFLLGCWEPISPFLQREEPPWLPSPWALGCILCAASRKQPEDRFSRGISSWLPLLSSAARKVPREVAQSLFGH